MIVDKIRSNILTEGSITELVRAVDEEMDGIASEQRKRLETIDTELEDVKRRLGRIWNAIETSDIDIADASDRVKEHRERKERLEDAAADARAILSQRRAHLDDVKTISAYAKDMKDFLQESELTERRSFIESFVKEIIVIPGDAVIRYTVPMPDDSFLAGRATEKVALDASVLSTVHVSPPEKNRTVHRAYLGSQATSGRLPHLPSVSAYYPVTTHQRPCVPTRHTTGIERPWCVDRLPSHISKMVVSTVCVGGPIGSNRAPSSTRVASILGIIGGDGGSQGGAVRLDELKRVQTC